MGIQLWQNPFDAQPKSENDDSYLVNRTTTVPDDPPREVQ